MNLGLFIIPSQYLAPLFSSGWWWLEHLDYDFPIILGISSSQLKIQKSSALREYGYAKPIFSVDGRAQLVDGSRTSKAVWKYLHPGGYTVANFTRPWSPKQGWMCTNCEVSKQSRAHVIACKHSWTKLTKLTFIFFRGVGQPPTSFPSFFILLVGKSWDLYGCHVSRPIWVPFSHCWAPTGSALHIGSACHTGRNKMI
jgi:hypothetical protein